eukprot:m.283899 g.283899  ORF g.283899 m.283899 type:complete len:388 (+) comp16339_c0_seq1:277-1440(+)
MFLFRIFVFMLPGFSIASEVIIKGKSITVSSEEVGFPPVGCLDGSKVTGMCHTLKEDDPWVQIDLGDEYIISEIHIYNRFGTPCEQRLFCTSSNCEPCSVNGVCNDPNCTFVTHVGDTPCGQGDKDIACDSSPVCVVGDDTSPQIKNSDQFLVTARCTVNLRGRYVTVRLPGKGRTLHLFELEAKGRPTKSYFGGEVFMDSTLTVSGEDITQSLGNLRSSIQNVLTQVAQETGRLDERITQIDGRVTQLQGSVNVVTEDIQVLQQGQVNFSLWGTELSNNLEQVKRDVGSVNAQVLFLNNEMETIVSELLEVGDAVADVKTYNISKLEAENAQLRNEISRLDGSLQQQNKIHKQELLSLEANISQLVSMIEDIKKPCVCEEKHGCRP